jgi:hypothetical protein
MFPLLDRIYLYEMRCNSSMVGSKMQKDSNSEWLSTQKVDAADLYVAELKQDYIIEINP